MLTLFNEFKSDMRRGANRVRRELVSNMPAITNNIINGLNQEAGGDVGAYCDGFVDKIGEAVEVACDDLEACCGGFFDKIGEAVEVACDDVGACCDGFVDKIGEAVEVTCDDVGACCGGFINSIFSRPEPRIRARNRRR
jgi:fumarylacetoacetate (FAA) hydrolase family protein